MTDRTWRDTTAASRALGLGRTAVPAQASPRRCGVRGRSAGAGEAGTDARARQAAAGRGRLRFSSVRAAEVLPKGRGEAAARGAGELSQCRFSETGQTKSPARPGFKGRRNGRRGQVT